MPAPDIVVELKRSLRLLFWATVILYAIVISASFLAWKDARDKRESIRRQAQASNTALCTLRGDLQQRVKSTQDFLDKHPEGFLGIPAATLRANLANQQRTIDALDNLRCTK